MKTISAVLLSLVFLCPFAHSQTNVSGKAISFNGTTGYLSVPNGTWFGSGDFTIEAWVYVRSHQNWARLIDFSNGANHDNVYLALSGNNFGCPTFGVFGGGLASSSQADSPVPLPLNQWTHLAVTFAGGGNHHLHQRKGCHQHRIRHEIRQRRHADQSRHLPQPVSRGRIS